MTTDIEVKRHDGKIILIIFLDGVEIERVTLNEKNKRQNLIRANKLLRK